MRRRLLHSGVLCLEVVIIVASVMIAIDLIIMARRKRIRCESRDDLFFLGLAILGVYIFPLTCCLGMILPNQISYLRKRVFR